MQAKPKILVLFYSATGHTSLLAQAIAEGAKSAGAVVDIKRVKEIASKEDLKEWGADKYQDEIEKFPLVIRDELSNYDGFIIGAPTRYGIMAAPMKAFIDTLNPLSWKNALKGKVASVFTSGGRQHTGLETTLVSLMLPCMCLGCILVGCPPDSLVDTLEISGGGIYGSATISLKNGNRAPSDMELEFARTQGKYVTEVTAKLIGVGMRKVEVEKK